MRRGFYSGLIAILIWLSVTAGAIADTIPNEWTTLGEAQIPGLSAQFFQDIHFNPQTNSNPDAVRVLQIQQPQQEHSLYVLLGTFATGGFPFCGNHACSSWFYLQQEDQFVQVFQAYVPFRNSETSQTPLVQYTDQIANGMPCLLWNAPETPGGSLVTQTLCFNGQQYQVE
jgi:hypothetical protein